MPKRYNRASISAPVTALTAFRSHSWKWIMRSFFVPQLAFMGALLLLTLLELETQLPFVVLAAGLIGMWLLGAIMAPFSLLLSALAFAGTVGTMGHVNLYEIPFSLNGLLTVGLGAACGLAVVVHYRQQFRTVPQIRRWVLDSAPLSLLLAWGLLRMPSAPVLNDAASDILIWTAVLLVYVLARAYWMENPDMLAAGERAFLYVAIVPLVMIVADALLGNVYFNTTTAEISLGLQTTSGARSLPVFFGLALIPLLARLRFGPREKSPDRRYLLALSAILAVWVYFSLARTALLSTAGIVFPMMLLAPRSLWKAIAVVAVGLLVTAAVLRSPLYPRPDFVDVGSLITVEEDPAALEDDLEGDEEAGPVRPRVQVDRQVLQGFSFGRADAWEYLAKTGARENPFFGFGTGASRSYVKNIVPGFDHAHNDYIRVFFDLGAVGLLIFLVSWAIKLLTLWQKWVGFSPGTPVAFRSFAALTAGGFFLLNAVTDNPVVYFFVLGPLFMLLAMADVERVRAESRPEAAQPAETLFVLEASDRGAPVPSEH